MLFIVILLLLLLFTMYFIKKSRTRSGSVTADGENRVIVMIIDSLMHEPLQKAINQGKAPALEFFFKKGSYTPAMISAYPTMSVAIDSTLLTGSSPDEHTVPGLVWYNDAQKKLISYGSAAGEIWRLGIGNVLRHSLYELNNEHLSRNVTTLHEEVADTASINGLVYRGNRQKELRVPASIRWTALLPRSIQTDGTSLFSFGALSKLNPTSRNSHFWQAFGFNDAFTASELIYLIKKRALPRFTIAYFPHNDKIVHKKGPGTIKGIMDTDRHLQNILNTYASWNEALKDTTWVIMGDSGQARVGYQDRAYIHLRSSLHSYRVPELSTVPAEDSQIVLALNERMAYIYLLDERLSEETVSNELAEDERIGFVAFKNGEKITVVCARRPGSFTFCPGGAYCDRFSQKWEMEGDPGILDITVEKNHLHYGEYPDALSRLTSAFHSHKGRFLIADALPGYEFKVKGSPGHKGGASHGSLHKTDSLVPMIVTGTTTAPVFERIVDMKKWLLSLLNER